jgi:hypothetical protein
MMQQKGVSLEDNIDKIQHLNVSRDSAVGIATGYGLDD